MSGYLFEYDFDGSISASRLKSSVYGLIYESAVSEAENGDESDDVREYMLSPGDRAKEAASFKIFDKVFNSQAAGDGYIRTNYPNIDSYAFKIGTPVYIETQSMKDLDERIQREIDKACNYSNKHHVKNRKSQYVGCQKCGSKLNKDYVPDDNCCPLCHTPLYSKTDLETLKRYDDNIQRWSKELEDKKQKSIKYDDVVWHVNTRYH